MKARILVVGSSNTDMIVKVPHLPHPGETVLGGVFVTAAGGNIFNGALAVAMAEGRKLDDAVRFANTAAALSVMRLSAQPSAPARTRIQRFLNSHAV
jgi:sugar/nucleoside kinase (ribokinase family)